MNKKVIAMAIAAAMVAPLTAQAEDGLSFNGAVGLQVTSGSASEIITDNGATKFEAHYNMGGFMFKAGINLVGGSGVRGFGYRDVYAGYKGDWGQITYGRINQATKNMESDPFITTFMELRAGVYSGSGGYSEYDNVQYAGKFGGIKVKVDLAGDGTVGGANGIGLQGANWWFATDTGTTPVMKLGATFGAIDVGYDGTNTTNPAIVLGYNMEAMGGKMNLTFATAGNNAANSAYRVAWKGKLAGYNMYGGFASNINVADGLEYGMGVQVKF